MSREHNPDRPKAGKPATPPRDQDSVLAAPEFITVRAAAGRLSVSVKMIYKLLDRGDLAGLNIGAARRVRVASLERYIAAHATGAEPEPAPETAPAAPAPSTRPARRRPRKTTSGGYRFFPPTHP